MNRIIAAAVGATGVSAYFDALMEMHRGTDVWLEDYDCYHVAQEPINWNEAIKVTQTLPKSDWMGELQPYIAAFDPFVLNDYALDKLAGECPAGALWMLVLSILPCRAHLHHGWPIAEEHVEPCDWFGRRISYLFGRVSIRVLSASRFPILKMLTSSTNLATTPELGCHDAEQTVVDWNRFRESLWAGNWGDRFATDGNWFDNTLDFVIHDSFDFEPKPLAMQCYVGLIFGFAAKMTICASSESGCFYSYARPLQVFLGTSPINYFLNSEWPLALTLEHFARTSRHGFDIDFSEAELLGKWPGSKYDMYDVNPALPHYNVNPGQSFLDFYDSLPLLPAPEDMEYPCIFVTVVYGQRFVKYLEQFVGRFQGLEMPLAIFALDELAYNECQRVSEGHNPICVRGRPSIMNKFTLPLLYLYAGFDVMWVDFDVFVMQDPRPVVYEQAREGDYELLISGSVGSSCICSGIIWYKSTEKLIYWLFMLFRWMYDHPFEHDQKTMAAFLDHTERNSAIQIPAPVPKWHILDPNTRFVTAAIFRDTGWFGDLRDMVMFHFLHGDSDTGAKMNPSGVWRDDHGMLVDEISYLDVMFGTAPKEVYKSPFVPVSPQILHALELSRVNETNLDPDIMSRPCGPFKLGSLFKQREIPPQSRTPWPWIIGSGLIEFTVQDLNHSEFDLMLQTIENDPTAVVDSDVKFIHIPEKYSEGCTDGLFMECADGFFQ